ncbi:MAG TPA: PKD domain-containing protein [Thermoplasmata archaeon]|nr:PKD domain-containing protein [Thermoplasmata archaeon]
MTLSETGISPAALSLGWTQASGFLFADYTVDESTSGAGGPWSVLATYTSNTQTSFGAGDLAPGAESWWEVLNYNSLGGSSTSNVVDAVQPPVAMLNVTQPSGSSATFNWTNNASYGGTLAFTSYDLYEEKNGTTPTVVASIVNPSVLTFTVTSLAGGVGYSFYLNSTDCYSGCGAGGQAYSTTESNVVNIGTPLPLGASVSASRSFVDAGEPDLFNCNPTGGVTPYSFNWSFDGSAYTPAGQSINHAFAAGAANASCRVTDSSHATALAATSITVNPAPTITASVNRSAADLGQELAYACTPANGSAPFTTSWSYGDGSPLGAAVSTHTYATAGSVVATCTATDQADVQVSDQFPVLLSPDPTVSASVSALVAAPLTVLTFTGTPQAGSGTWASTQWNFGDGSNAHGSRLAHAFTTAGNFTASYHATDSNGLTASQNFALTIRTLAVAVLSAPSAAHPGAKLTFTANATGGAAGPYNYTWTFGDGSVGYGASVEHTYSAPNTFHPTLVVTDALGATAAPTLPAVAVTTPPPPAPAVSIWEILAIGLVAGLLIGLVAYARLRRGESEELRGKAPWVPTTDPNRTVRGVKVCRSCGTANLPIRTTCEACGHDLPRWAQRTNS